MMIDVEWINISEALRIANSYPKGPHSRNAIVWAGKHAGFIRTAHDKFHHEFNKERLERYCEISNKPTLEEIAEVLDTSLGCVKYYTLKFKIDFRIEMGRKYLEKQDAEKLIKLYKENHNGK